MFAAHDPVAPSRVGPLGLIAKQFKLSIIFLIIPGLFRGLIEE